MVSTLTADTHVATAIDDNGGLLGVESFPATEAGFAELLGWLIGFGSVTQIGVEAPGRGVSGYPGS